jgi:putative endonuclease
LCRKVYGHKNHLVKDSFTHKYNLEYCIYYEEFSCFDLAIKREKELKKWNRQKKVDLINKKNPEWKVLATEDGFVRATMPFSQQVSNLVKEMQQKNEIPPCGRNDGPVYLEKGEAGSGGAASRFPTTHQKVVVISSEVRNPLNPKVNVTANTTQEDHRDSNHYNY